MPIQRPKNRSVNSRNQSGKRREGYRLTAVETATLAELVPREHGPGAAGAQRGLVMLVGPGHGNSYSRHGPTIPNLTPPSTEALCSYWDGSVICNSKKK